MVNVAVINLTKLPEMILTLCQFHILLFREQVILDFKSKLLFHCVTPSGLADSFCGACLSGAHDELLDAAFTDLDGFVDSWRALLFLGLHFFG